MRSPIPAPSPLIYRLARLVAGSVALFNGREAFCASPFASWPSTPSTTASSFLATPVAAAQEEEQKQKAGEITRLLLERDVAGREETRTTDGASKLLPRTRRADIDQDVDMMSYPRTSSTSNKEKDTSLSAAAPKFKRSVSFSLSDDKVFIIPSSYDAAEEVENNAAPRVHDQPDDLQPETEAEGVIEVCTRRKGSDSSSSDSSDDSSSEDPGDDDEQNAGKTISKHDDQLGSRLKGNQLVLRSTTGSGGPRAPRTTTPEAEMEDVSLLTKNKKSPSVRDPRHDEQPAFPKSRTAPSGAGGFGLKNDSFSGASARQHRSFFRQFSEDEPEPQREPSDGVELLSGSAEQPQETENANGKTTIVEVDPEMAALEKQLRALALLKGDARASQDQLWWGVSEEEKASMRRDLSVIQTVFSSSSSGNTPNPKNKPNKANSTSAAASNVDKSGTARESEADTTPCQENRNHSTIGEVPMDVDADVGQIQIDLAELHQGSPPKLLAVQDDQAARKSPTHEAKRHAAVDKSRSASSSVVSAMPSSGLLVPPPTSRGVPTCAVDTSESNTVSKGSATSTPAGGSKKKSKSSPKKTNDGRQRARRDAGGQAKDHTGSGSVNIAKSNSHQAVENHQDQDDDPSKQEPGHETQPPQRETTRTTTAERVRNIVARIASRLANTGRSCTSELDVKDLLRQAARQGEKVACGIAHGLAHNVHETVVDTVDAVHNYCIPVGEFYLRHCYAAHFNPTLAYEEGELICGLVTILFLDKLGFGYFFQNAQKRFFDVYSDMQQALDDLEEHYLQEDLQASAGDQTQTARSMTDELNAIGVAGGPDERFAAAEDDEFENNTNSARSCDIVGQRQSTPSQENEVNDREGAAGANPASGTTGRVATGTSTTAEVSSDGANARPRPSMMNTDHSHSRFDVFCHRVVSGAVQWMYDRVKLSDEERMELELEKQLKVDVDTGNACSHEGALLLEQMLVKDKKGGITSSGSTSAGTTCRSFSSTSTATVAGPSSASSSSCSAKGAVGKGAASSKTTVAEKEKDQELEKMQKLHQMMKHRRRRDLKKISEMSNNGQLMISSGVLEQGMANFKNYNNHAVGGAGGATSSTSPLVGALGTAKMKKKKEQKKMISSPATSRTSAGAPAAGGNLHLDQDLATTASPEDISSQIQIYNRTRPNQPPTADDKVYLKLPLHAIFTPGYSDQPGALEADARLCIGRPTMVWDAPAERWRKFLIKEVTEDGQGSAAFEKKGPCAIPFVTAPPNFGGGVAVSAVSGTSAGPSGATASTTYAGPPPEAALKTGVPPEASCGPQQHTTTSSSQSKRRNNKSSLISSCSSGGGATPSSSRRTSKVDSSRAGGPKSASAARATGMKNKFVLLEEVDSATYQEKLCEVQELALQEKRDRTRFLWKKLRWRNLTVFTIWMFHVLFEVHCTCNPEDLSFISRRAVENYEGLVQPTATEQKNNFLQFCGRTDHLAEFSPTTGGHGPSGGPGKAIFCTHFNEVITGFACYFVFVVDPFLRKKYGFLEAGGA
ncbi:unnamed protein product [Amoebophrya sp. A120]|nr:unnamed protein product [Amoebophrya sp. A120]|eukprot:GSA120T00007619001.1